MSWNPFNRQPKKAENIEAKVPVENRTERETVFVSLEYHLANAFADGKGINALFDDLIVRIKDGTRSKTVLFSEFNREEYYKGILSKTPRKYFHDLLIKNIQDKKRILIERYSTAKPDFLEDNERHEVLEQIQNINAEKYTWLFVYNEDEKTMMNPGNVKGIYSLM